MAVKLEAFLQVDLALIRVFDVSILLELVVERNGHLQKFCRRTDTLGEVSASGCVDFVLFEIGIWTVSVVVR
jgi:hypothetical protein